MKTILITAVLLIATLWGYKHWDYGSDRYFADQTYHHLTMRALGQITYGGADTAEVLQTVKHIRAGDPESWYAAWHGAAERVAGLGNHAKDPVSKGRALLRVHNYYRTAEFLLLPSDVRRKAAWTQQTTSFYQVLDALGVRYEGDKDVPDPVTLSQVELDRCPHLMSEGVRLGSSEANGLRNIIFVHTVTVAQLMSLCLVSVGPWTDPFQQQGE